MQAIKDAFLNTRKKAADTNAKWRLKQKEAMPNVSTVKSALEELTSEYKRLSTATELPKPFREVVRNFKAWVNEQKKASAKYATAQGKALKAKTALREAPKEGTDTPAIIEAALQIMIQLT